MAKEKTKESRIKRLYKRLNAHSDQPVLRLKRDDSCKSIVTNQGRIMQAIQTLENTKK